MAPLNIDNTDIYGREGHLEVGDQNIPTPNYIPTRSEFLNLKESPLIEKKDYKMINFGVYGYWLNDTTIKMMSKKGKVYQNLKKYLKERIQIIETPVRMLHFEFKPDVSRLDGQSVKLLLDLQESVGANVIEIPNTTQNGDFYNKTLEKAIEWKKSNAIDKQLMGIAYEPKDVKMIKSKIKEINSIGIHLHSENFPLMYEIEETVRQLGIWTHAFAAPRSYKKVNYKGTMGIFLNKFGIDTFSTYVAPSEVARNFSYAQENKTESQKQNDAQESKYFNPIDYSTTKFAELIKTTSPEIKPSTHLSQFCSCPICKKHTMQSMVSDFNFTHINTRSHEVLANINESAMVKDKIKNNEFDTYLSSKVFAHRLTQRTQSKLQS